MRPISHTLRFVALAALVGCDISSSAPSPTTTTTTTPDVSAFTKPDTQTTIDPGTQVGSEGFWGCKVVDRYETNGDDLVPNTGATAVSVTAGLLGGWTMTALLLDDSTRDASLRVGPALRYHMVLMEAPCADYIEVDVQAQSTVSGESPVDMAGILALSEQGSGIRVHGLSTDDSATTSWGPAPAGGLSFLRFEADLDEKSMVGDISWTDCTEATCDLQIDVGVFEAAK